MTVTRCKQACLLLCGMGFLARAVTPFEAAVAPNIVPGKFPASACDSIQQHHQCVSTKGCGWLRTIANGGICREDPVSRCLSESPSECVCRAHDFHGGDSAYEADLELFIPLSILWTNMAQKTTSRYSSRIEIGEIHNEQWENFTSRTDFTYKKLVVTASSSLDFTDLMQASGFSLSLKFMHVWDKAFDKISGSLFNSLGINAVLKRDKLTLIVDGVSHDIHGEASGGKVKNFQCNQLVIVVSSDSDAMVYLGSSVTVIPGLRMQKVRSHINSGPDPLELISVGDVNAKVWDLRLYGNGRLLNSTDVRTVGKRCGSAGDYSIPSNYPTSNKRYSWGMGGWKINPDHDKGQSYSSGVYATMWIPTTDTWPPRKNAAGTTYLQNLQRMIGFWDRWHEQMFFEADFIPYVDTRSLAPVSSTNAYRNYSASNNPCQGGTCTGEPTNYNNPCRYVTDLFQGLNWLAQDFPGEPTSAQHRKMAEKGGWARWNSYSPPTYDFRPVHEHGHTAHFTLMRTYQKLHHYVRGIAGESFAEVMTGFVMPGAIAKSWMAQGLTYYPTIPLSFEGKFDKSIREHVFKSPQPYQEGNIGSQGLGARFYGLQVWWMYVSHYAGKPYLPGRLAVDTDQIPGTTLQKLRFYLAQEDIDLGDLFGNFAAQVVTWDWPYLGSYYYQKEQAPYKGIAAWCTQNTGCSCTADDLKVQVSLDAAGTGGAWVEGPSLRKPGGFAFSTVRINSAPGGSFYEIGLEFDVPSELYAGEAYSINIAPHCRDDGRFFSNRIVVADVGSEGQESRAHRPEYYKAPGRFFDSMIVKVPDNRPSNIYLMAIPTPPFDLEDVYPFVKGHSLVWTFRYKIRRLSSLPSGASTARPQALSGNEVLSLTRQPGNGFLYDCFDPAFSTSTLVSTTATTSTTTTSKIATTTTTTRATDPLICHMFYLMADTNLEREQVKDVEELSRNLEAMNSDAYVPYIFMDRHRRRDRSVINAIHYEDGSPVGEEKTGGLVATKVHLNSNILTMVADMGEVNSDSAATLQQFIENGIDHCFALTNRTRPVRWFFSYNSHGAGWMGIGGDEHVPNGTESWGMSLLQFRSAFTGALASRGIAKFDLLGFDACLMSAHLVLSTLENVSDYIFAAEDTEPAHGWDYTALRPTSDPISFASSLMDGFLSFTSGGQHQRPKTLSIVNTFSFGKLRRTLEEIASDMARRLGAGDHGLRKGIDRARKKAFRFVGPTIKKTVVDMSSFFKSITQKCDPEAGSDLSSLLDLAESQYHDMIVRVANAPGTSSKYSGVHVFFPSPKHAKRAMILDPSVYYRLTEEGAPLWGRFLKTFYDYSSSKKSKATVCQKMRKSRRLRDNNISTYCKERECLLLHSAVHKEAGNFRVSARVSDDAVDVKSAFGVVCGNSASGAEVTQRAMQSFNRTKHQDIVPLSSSLKQISVDEDGLSCDYAASLLERSHARNLVLWAALVEGDFSTDGASFTATWDGYTFHLDSTVVSHAHSWLTTRHPITLEDIDAQNGMYIARVIYFPYDATLSLQNFSNREGGFWAFVSLSVNVSMPEVPTAVSLYRTTNQASLPMEDNSFSKAGLIAVSPYEGGHILPILTGQIDDTPVQLLGHGLLEWSSHVSAIGSRDNAEQIKNLAALLVADHVESESSDIFGDSILKSFTMGQLDESDSAVANGFGRVLLSVLTLVMLQSCHH